MKNKFNSVFNKLNPNDDKNPNSRYTRKNMTLVAIVVIVLLVVVLGFNYYKKNKKKVGEVTTGPQFVKVHDENFSSEDSRSAMYHQQGILDNNEKNDRSQTHKISKLEESLKRLIEDRKQDKRDMHALLKSQNLDLKNKINSKQGAEAKSASKDKAEKKPFSPVGGVPQSNQKSFGTGSRSQQGYQPPQMPTMPKLVTVSLSEMEEEGPFIKTFKNFVPPGSFCRAVILGGADANAGVNGTAESSPILFKVMNNCYLPNGKKSKLKGSLITASIYGNISTERGIVRLDNLSLVRKDGTILDIPVEGTAFDIGGKNGIKGVPNLRNAQILEKSGLSGLFAGLGSSLAAAAQTQSVSPLGVTNSIDPTQIPLNALGEGTNTAFSQISNYYIKLANLYSPSIDVMPGGIVDIVFLKGFPLVDQSVIDSYESRVTDKRQIIKSGKGTVNSAINSSNSLMQQLPKPLSQANLGDSVYGSTLGRL